MLVSAVFDVRHATHGEDLVVRLRLQALPSGDGDRARLVRAARLAIHLKPGAQLAEVDEGGGAGAKAGSVVLDLGDVDQGEDRELAMTFQVPGSASLGLIRIAVLELQYVELPAGTQHLLTLPIAVEASAGDGRSRVVTPAWAERSGAGWFRIAGPRGE